MKSKLNVGNAGQKGIREDALVEALKEMRAQREIRIRAEKRERQAKASLGKIRGGIGRNEPNKGCPWPSVPAGKGPKLGCVRDA